MKQHRIADDSMQLEKYREHNPEQHNIADVPIASRIGICVIIMEETRNETCNRFNRPDRGRD